MKQNLTAVVFSLGCKVNQYESGSVAALLESHGFDVSDKLAPADLYVINTCSVTSEADKKSRQAVARALGENLHGRVVIIGCSSQNDPAPFLEKNVLWVSGVGGKLAAVERALQLFFGGGSKPDSRPCLDLPAIYEDDGQVLSKKSRPLIKIQEGCNNFCSYCRVPYLRGRSRSKSLSAIVAEVENSLKTNDEIVLTGIDISSYGLDIGTSLTALMRALSGKERKRLSSLECGVIDDGFLVAARDGGFCDHFHLSLQSGSDTVLRRMNRRYTTKEYLNKVNLIRSVFPLAGITTDIISGFPEETDAEHCETVAFLDKAQFSAVHVFPYSKRAGTAAYSMPQLQRAVKVQRAAEVAAAAEKYKKEFLQKNLHRTAQVLLETSDNGQSIGFTTNYIKVYTDIVHKGLIDLRLKQIYKSGVKGYES